MNCPIVISPETKYLVRFILGVVRVAGEHIMGTFPGCFSITLNASYNLWVCVIFGLVSILWNSCANFLYDKIVCVGLVI